MFGEREAGVLVLQNGKRSSGNGVQTTFGSVGKGSGLERPRATAYTLHRYFKFCVICKLAISSSYRNGQFVVFL